MKEFIQNGIEELTETVLAFGQLAVGILLDALLFVLLWPGVQAIVQVTAHWSFGSLTYVQALALVAFVRIFIDHSFVYACKDLAEKELAVRAYVAKAEREAALASVGASDDNDTGE